MTNDETTNHYLISAHSGVLGPYFTPLELVAPWFDLASSIVPRGSLAYDLCFAIAHELLQALAVAFELREAKPKGINANAEELRAGLETLRAHELVEFKAIRDVCAVVFLRWPATHSLHAATRVDKLCRYLNNHPSQPPLEDDQ